MQKRFACAVCIIRNIILIVLLLFKFFKCFSFSDLLNLVQDKLQRVFRFLVRHSGCQVLVGRERRRVSIVPAAALASQSDSSTFKEVTTALLVYS